MECIRCSKKFTKEDPRWDMLKKDSGIGIECVREGICPSCAAHAIEAKEDGIFTATCEKCGEDFDMMRDSKVFELEIQDLIREGKRYPGGLPLSIFWKKEYLCEFCGMVKCVVEEG